MWLLALRLEVLEVMMGTACPLLLLLLIIQGLDDGAKIRTCVPAELAEQLTGLERLFSQVNSGVGWKSFWGEGLEPDAGGGDFAGDAE